MPTKKCLTVTALTHMSVTSDLGLGHPVGLDLRVTNSASRIAGFFSDHFQQMVGVLETQSLLNAKALLFEFTRLSPKTQGATLIKNVNHYMGRARICLVGLWLIKDNSVDFELSFSEIPHHANPSRVTSNFLANATSFSDGTTKETEFSSSELDEVRRLLEAKNVEVLSLEDSPRPPSLGRIERALYFLQAARGHRDLTLKIAFYCISLEALFATTSIELSHKLSERVAYFTADSAHDRASVYKNMKDAYTVRSAVMHGDVVSSKHRSRLTDHSVFCDKTLRKTVRTLFSDSGLAKTFASKNMLETYMRDLTLGIIPPPVAA